MVVYYLILRGINLNSLILLPIFLILTLKSLTIAFNHRRDKFVILMNMFLMYSLLSGMFYAFNDAPFSCYTTTLRSFIFPIVFGYLGYSYSSDQQFNKWYIYGCAFCFIIGFYLYTVVPSYYAAYMAEVRENAFNASEWITEANIMEYTRFSSFFATSYAISCLSIPALILSLSFSLKSKTSFERTICYVIAFVSVVAAFLCQQRISIGFALLILMLWPIILNMITNTRGIVNTVIAFVFGIMFVFFALGEITHFEWYTRSFGQVSNVLDQMNFTDAMSSRTGQYTAFNRMTDFSLFFGLGLGSCGHAATAAGLRSIADGEFIKLFYEFGVVGCSFLFVLFFLTLKRGMKYFRLYYAEVLIIVFYFAAGIASDSLTFFLYSIMFWYSLGRIWNKKYFERLKNERIENNYGISK